MKKVGIVGQNSTTRNFNKLFTYIKIADNGDGSSFLITFLQASDIGISQAIVRNASPPQRKQKIIDYLASLGYAQNLILPEIFQFVSVTMKSFRDAHLNVEQSTEDMIIDHWDLLAPNQPNLPAVITPIAQHIIHAFNNIEYLDDLECPQWQQQNVNLPPFFQTQIMQFLTKIHNRNTTLTFNDNIGKVKTISIGDINNISNFQTQFHFQTSYVQTEFDILLPKHLNTTNIGIINKSYIINNLYNFWFQQKFAHIPRPICSQLSSQHQILNFTKQKPYLPHNDKPYLSSNHPLNKNSKPIHNVFPWSQHNINSIILQQNFKNDFSVINILIIDEISNIPPQFVIGMHAGNAEI